MLGGQKFKALCSVRFGERIGMRILHTADWHLGDRLGRIDRTSDLRRAVERVAGIAMEEGVDAVLVAGDLFSEPLSAAARREALEHLSETFGKYLRGGGTILAVTGNHDNPTFCRTVARALELGDPGDSEAGGLARPGRAHLIDRPTLLRLPRRDGGPPVRFAMLPWPTSGEYLGAESAGGGRSGGGEDRSKRLGRAFADRLREMERSDGEGPRVVCGHVSVAGARASGLYRITERDDVVVWPSDLPMDWDYLGFGHIHRAQDLSEDGRARYSGSVERMDIGEDEGPRSVTIVELPERAGAGPARIRTVETPSTPFVEARVSRPSLDLPRLIAEHGDGRSREALARIDVTYRAGEDNLDEILRTMEDLFPRWYKREWREASASVSTATRSALADSGIGIEVGREVVVGDERGDGEADGDGDGGVGDGDGVGGGSASRRSRPGKADVRATILRYLELELGGRAGGIEAGELMAEAEELLAELESEGEL